MVTIGKSNDLTCRFNLRQMRPRGTSFANVQLLLDFAFDTLAMLSLSQVLDRYGKVPPRSQVLTERLLEGELRGCTKDL